MNKKIASIIAAVLALTLAMGLTVFATESAQTDTITVDTTTSSSSSDSTATAATPNYVMAKPSSSGVTTTSYVGGAKVQGDYTSVSDANIIFTSIVPFTAAEKAAAQQIFASSSKISPVMKVQAYRAGVPVYGNYGTFKLRVSVGNSYNGRTVYANVYANGTVTKVPVVVAGGYVAIPVTDTAAYVTVSLD